jgi:Carbohydrate family 9 binding domain-like
MSALCLLGLSGCLRFGYAEQRVPAADGGRSGSHTPKLADAGSPDAGTEHDAASADPDAAAHTDASQPKDASMSRSDASDRRDSAVTTPDASMSSDATMSTTDASLDDAAMAIDAGPDCTPSAPRDYCARLPALSQAPQLDGVLDCGPPLAALSAMGWNSSQSMPADNQARYAAAWRPDGLYIYVEVDDPLLLPALASDVDPWCGDGVELYADADGNYVSAPDYDDPGAMQLLATSPARDSSTALAVDARYHTRSLARAGDWTAARHVTVKRTGGYALEAFIEAADLELSSWSLAAGGKVGFDIAINVSVTDESQKVGCGYNLGQYYLRVSKLPCNSDNCRPYSNATAFCTALLE